MKATDYEIPVNLVKGDIVEEGCHIYISFLLLHNKLPQILEDFFISQSGVGYSLPGSLLRVSQDCKVSTELCFHLESSLERICFQLTQVVGRIHLFVVVYSEPHFFLAAGGRLPSAPRGHLQSLVMWTFPTWLFSSNQQGGPWE